MRGDPIDAAARHAVATGDAALFAAAAEARRVERQCRSELPCGCQSGFDHETQTIRVVRPCVGHRI